jgi:phosphoglycolate phosphatase/pyrophosphatase PpaX
MLSKENMMSSSGIGRKQFKAVLFDLDGTLLDSFSVHYEVYEIMFARFGIQITKESFLSTYSPNWYETYQAMGLPKEDWDAANSYWVEEAEKRNSELLPGVYETLSQLDGRFTLGLVTSGSKSRVLKDIERTGIGGFFKTIVTGNDIQTPKPAPEGLELALRSLRMESNEVVYIGDAFADYEMAKAAGVHFLGVSSSFANLNSDHPGYEVHSIIDLPELLGTGP